MQQKIYIFKKKRSGQQGGLRAVLRVHERLKIPLEISFVALVFNRQARNMFLIKVLVAQYHSKVLVAKYHSLGL